MKAFAAHGDFFASAAVAPQGASRWHLNQIYCECEAFTVKPRRVCRPQAAKKLESFSAGACTWQKIPLRLQVWNLFAYGEQIMRAADCKNWRKSPKGFSDKLSCPGKPGQIGTFAYFTVTEVTWGCIPLYQYRKPSTSILSPTFRPVTVLYTSVPSPHR